MSMNSNSVSHGYCCECKYWRQVANTQPNRMNLCVKFSKESYQHVYKRGQNPFDYCTAFEPIDPNEERNYND